MEDRRLRIEDRGWRIEDGESTFEDRALLVFDGTCV